MAMITNIKNSLDENGEVPDLPSEAKELLIFLTAIIEAATADYERPETLSAINCRKKLIMGKPCSGEIDVWVYAEDNQIGWECLECGDGGVISNWEGTPWINVTIHGTSEPLPNKANSLGRQKAPLLRRSALCRR